MGTIIVRHAGGVFQGKTAPEQKLRIVIPAPAAGIKQGKVLGLDGKMLLNRVELRSVRYHTACRRSTWMDSPAPKATTIHRSPALTPLSMIFLRVNRTEGEDTLP